MVVQYLGCIAIEFQIANDSPDEGNLDLDNLDITWIIMVYSQTGNLFTLYSHWNQGHYICVSHGLWGMAHGLWVTTHVVIAIGDTIMLLCSVSSDQQI